MKWFRLTLRKNRIFIITLLTVNVFHMVDGRHFVYAHQVHQQKQDRLEEISEMLDIPVEKLRPDHDSLFDSLQKAFGVKSQDPVKVAGLERLQEVLREHEEQVAANPYLPQIEAVKNAYQLHRVEGMIRDLTQLTRSTKALPESSQKALLRNLHHGLSERVELPPLPEGLPDKARARHTEMQAKLDLMFNAARPIVASTQDGETMLGTIAQKVEQLRLHQGVETKRAARDPRFVDRPLPLRRVEKKARTSEVSALEMTKTGAPTPASTSVSPPALKVLKDGVASEIVELAESLGNSPARIFSYVHDTIDFDAKWGAFKGPLETLWERSGTSWEQAWLLQQLLQAAGVDARFEWGEIEISTERLTNITGLDDPWRAGDLLTTAGVPIVLLVQGSGVIGARMSHVWVKAFVDYLPNRGVDPGAGDTWIRMDPSHKRYDYAPGIQIHDDVPFSLGGYLLSGTELSPRRAFEEALWGYIQANDIQCTTLEQLKPMGRVVAEAFPFLPGTLRGKILEVDGEASEVPAGFQERLLLEVRSASGASLMAWQSTVPGISNQRLELTWQGATADDQATLDSYGGVFETPPYLVDLKPVVKVGGLEQATGTGIGSAEDIEIYVTLTPAAGPADVLVHQGYAGEPSVLVTDFGHVPAEVLGQVQASVTAAEAAGESAEVEAATLQLIGTTYMHELGRDLEDLAGWTWHRLVRLVTEGLVVQTGKVATALDGSPISFTRAETFIDVAGMTLGLFHTEGEASFRKSSLELAGAQGSYLEGEVFSRVLQKEGIAAVSALTRAQREGQVLAEVDSSNVESVLAAVDLEDAVEDQIRSAVAAGKSAWVPEAPVVVNSWRGSGYILEDPATGAAAYLLSGGFAGGANTEETLRIFKNVFGSEAWQSSEPPSEVTALLLDFIGYDTDAYDGDDGQGPASNQSDPVNMATGNFWLTRTDFSIQARGLSVSWKRTYNSRYQATGPVGYGWTFTYGERLEEQPDGSILFREDDGTEHLFEENADGSYEAPPGKHLELTPEAGGFRLRHKNGLVTRFSPDGRLSSFADPSGNTITLGYGASGNLETVIDAAGRTVLSVEHSGDKVTRVSDLTGRAVTYEYTGEDLTRVTDSAGKVWSYSYDEDHNLISRSDPLGNTDSYSYDSLDRCVAHIDPLGQSDRFQYAFGRRATLTDPRGTSTYFEFDEELRPTLQVDPLGNATRSTWDEDNNRTSTVNPRGGVTLRTFDDQGNLLSVIDPIGQSRTYSYDPNFSKVQTITDDNGHVVTHTVNPSTGSLEKRSQVVDGQLIEETFVYDPDGQLVEMRDSNGNVTTMTWDPVKGSLETFVDPAGEITSFETDDLGRVFATHSPDGNTIQMAWDDRDRVERVTYPFGIVNEMIYDDAGRQIASTRPQGSETTTYDAAGRPIATTDVLGNTVVREFDVSGNMTAIIDPAGNRTSFFYDSVGRKLAETDAAGHTWVLGFCGEIGPGGGCPNCSSGSSGDGSFCEITDPLGNTTRQEFDLLARVISVEDPLGNETRFTYDSRGRRDSATDALGRTTRYEYDTVSRLTAVVEADGSRTEYAYDAQGNMINVKNAEGEDWSTTFTPRNKLESEVDPLGHATRYTYNKAGSLETVLYPNGDLVRYVWDARRLMAVEFPDGTEDSFSYDSSGRLVSMASSESSLSFVYDDLDRAVEMTDHLLNKAITHEYDENGNRVATVGPQGEVRYFYDARGLLREQHDPVTGTYRYSYDALGRRTKLEYPNGLETRFEYDAASRLLGVVTLNQGGMVVDGYSYSYDPVGNRTSMLSLRDGVDHQYTYDEKYRLERWDRGVDRFEAYTYDKVGNRLTVEDEQGTVTSVYDKANRLLEEVRLTTAGDSSTTTYSWDDNGNLLERRNGTEVVNYTYDFLNRLVGVTDGSVVHSYGYEPSGIRVRETTGSTTRRVLHAMEDIVGVYDEDGALETYYSHGPGIDEPLAQSRTGDVSYFHLDALGSVAAVSGASGQLASTISYAPFGAVEQASGDVPRYGFTGRELDATGLMYYRSRYVDPAQGRFTTQDRVRGQADIPMSLNRYSFVFNNPINHLDPSGAIVMIFGLSWVVFFGLLAIAALIGVGLELHHPANPDLRLDQQICKGVVKGIQWFLLTFFPAKWIGALISQALVWLAYYIGDVLGIGGPLGAMMGRIWHWAQNHGHGSHYLQGLVGGASVIKLSLELLAKAWLSSWKALYEGIDSNANWVCVRS